jgi:peptidase E
MNKKKPVYLLAGGRETKKSSLADILKKLLAETGKDKPSIAYIGAANGDDRWFYKFTCGFFKHARVSHVTQVFLADERADVAKAKAILGTADVVYVAGGDVEEGMDCLNKHNIVPYLKELYLNGVLFFGASAGSIMLGSKWVRWKNPDDDSTAELFDCLGIASIICDTHAEKDGWEELKAAVQLLDVNGKGYGIPTGCTIRLVNNDSITALGKPAVCYVNSGGRVIKTEDIPVLNPGKEKG